MYTIQAWSILLCAVFSCLQQSAQPRTDANLTGHIVKKGTHDHIPYVHVTLKGTTHGVVVDGSGHYFLKNLPEGTYTLAASGMGYTTQEKEVTLTARKTIEVNFELEESSILVDQIVVSANRQETNRREAPTIVHVLNTQLFESTASNNLSDALNYQSGLRVEFNCSNCGVSQLRINGLEGQYSQILLDSRPIFSSLANVYGLEQIPTSMIERVEVIRGGGSALFGANAIGGVVNIITKEPTRNSVAISNNTQRIDGTWDTNTSFNGSFVSDDYRAGLYVFGMIRDREGYDRNDDGFTEIPKLGSETVGFRGYYKTGGYSKLTAEYHHIREFRRGGDQFDRPPHEVKIAEQLRHKIDGGGLKYDLWSADQKHRENGYISM
ncbi:MAG: carboxypeptidase-like regulatory domain-containing protein [Rikenellaceae bacterium]|nr:carboxypeptidase-like regulatory domain-containing protein [Rikenellaceae bacterium]